MIADAKLVDYLFNQFFSGMILHLISYKHHVDSNSLLNKTKNLIKNI